MGVRDHAMDWARQRHVIEAASLSGFGGGAEDLTGGNVDLQEIGSLGYSLALFGSAGATVKHNMAIPSHWDLEHDIGVAIQLTTTSDTEDDQADFVCLWDTVGVGQALLGTNNGTEALDTVWDAFVVPADAVSHQLYETSRGVIDGGQLKKGGRLILDIEMDTLSAGFTENVFMVSLILDYMPKWCFGEDAVEDRDFSFKHSNE